MKSHDTNQEIHKGLGQDRQETQEVTGKTTKERQNTKTQNPDSTPSLRDGFQTSQNKVQAGWVEGAWRREPSNRATWATTVPVASAGHLGRAGRVTPASAWQLGRVAMVTVALAGHLGRAGQVMPPIGWAARAGGQDAGWAGREDDLDDGWTR